MTEHPPYKKLRGLLRNIRRRLQLSGTQADTSSLFGVPVKTVSWLPENKGLFVYNGVDQIVRLDGTNKEARYTTKQPKAVFFTLPPDEHNKLMRGLAQRFAPPRKGKK